jgi:MFS family permease
MPADKRRSLILLIIAEVLAMSAWFAGAAAVPYLRVDIGLSDSAASWLTSAVQAGFIVGTLVSAALNLPDRLDPRRLFACSALAAALSTAGSIVGPLSPIGLVAPRFLTGVALAGVYPVGLRIAASWADRDMGLLLGLLVGALTLGSALPHLFALLSWRTDWRVIFGASSALSVVAAAAILGTTMGPNRRIATRIQPLAAVQAFRDPALRLANLGYLGHMWELYAMWAWIGLFLRESFIASATPVRMATALTFATIAIGALGCVAGGLVADRWGRTVLTSGAMVVSGTCALAAGLLYAASPLFLAVVCLIWGLTIVADSAQFSSSIAELSPPAYVGSLLTIQTSAGFLLTIVTIQIVPVIAARMGWRVAFGLLAIGPYLGALAMWRLRQRPEALRLAAGRR